MHHVNYYCMAILCLGVVYSSHCMDQSDVTESIKMEQQAEERENEERRRIISFLIQPRFVSFYRALINNVGLTALEVEGYHRVNILRFKDSTQQEDGCYQQVNFNEVLDMVRDAKTLKKDSIGAFFKNPNLLQETKDEDVKTLIKQRIANLRAFHAWVLDEDLDGMLEKKKQLLMKHRVDFLGALKIGNIKQISNIIQNKSLLPSQLTNKK